MTLRQIITTVSGRRYGMDVLGNPVWNRNDGSQLVIDVNSATGEASITTTTSAVNGAVTNAFVIGQGNNVIPGVVGDDSTDNSAAIQAALGPTGTFFTAGKVTATFGKGGNYRLGITDVHRSISLIMDGRGAILARLNDNQPAVTPGLPYNGGANPGGSGGAESAMFRFFSSSPPSGSNLAWSPQLNGFNLDGRSANQTNQVHGIRIPNNDPSKNSFDPDPGFTGNKDYVAGSYLNGDVSNFTGSGIVVESTNGRLWLNSFRALNNLLHGIDAGGNDVVIDGHSAAGGNGGFGLKTGTGSGMLIVTGNFWGQSANRSLTCGAMWINQTKLTTITSCEFNDWLRIDTANMGSRGGSIQGCVFGPFDDFFTADGVSASLDNEPRTAAHMSIGGAGSGVYGHFNVIGNTFCRSTSVKARFNTPLNVGGALDGSAGTSFPHCIDVCNNQAVNIFDPSTSAPNLKPWVGSDPTPFIVRSGGRANYIHMDAHQSLVRIGALGSVHSRIALGMDETAFITDAAYAPYQVIAGDATQPSGIFYRNGQFGLWEFQKTEGYMDTAWDRRLFTSPGVTTWSRTATVGQRSQLIIMTGGTFATGTFNLPTDLNASQFFDLVIWGQNVTAFTLGVTGGGTLNTNIIPIPTAITQYLAIRFYYERDTNRWDPISISTPPIPDVSAKIGSGVPVSLTTATVTNVTTITLGQGIWDVTGVAVFTSTAATTTPSLTRLGISTVSATALPATDATAYASRGVNLGVVASGTDFDQLQVGVNRITVAAGTTQQVWLNCRSNFTGAAATMTAFGAIRAVPAVG